jgi:cyclopropane fatty-acyl-phospholipid synthase-like methyltransferase
MTAQPNSLSEPTVPPEVYDREYFLHHAAGSEEFKRGDLFAGRYHHVRELLDVPLGGTFLDAGCGRGELVCLVAASRAGRSIGIEYAPAAVKLAEEAASRAGVADRCRFLLGDVRAIPLADGEVDRAAMLDVIEHLTPDEQADALAELHRVLKRGGVLIVHTFPNRRVYSTYRWLRVLWPGGRHWPVEPRSQHEMMMHVGELSARDLRRRLCEAGFRSVEVTYTPWVYVDHLPSRRARRLSRLIARVPGLRALTRGSLMAKAEP